MNLTFLRSGSQMFLRPEFDLAADYYAHAIASSATIRALEWPSPPKLIDLGRHDSGALSTRGVGIFLPRRWAIGIHPAKHLDAFDMLCTILHELAHAVAAGYGDDCSTRLHDPHGRRWEIAFGKIVKDLTGCYLGAEATALQQQHPGVVSRRRALDIAAYRIHRWPFLVISPEAEDGDLNCDAFTFMNGFA